MASTPQVVCMTKSRLPTSNEIAELVAFLPRLYAEGFEPVDCWMGGGQDANGVFSLPWPEYNQVVTDFMHVAGRSCWLDFEYDPEVAHQMLLNDDVIRSASLAQVKTMLTFCVRGERFSDGHWAEMIESGYIRRLLERLIVLQSAQAS